MKEAGKVKDRGKSVRSREMMCANSWSGPDVPPYPVRAGWLLCAVCRRGGCPDPPPGRRKIDDLLKAAWSYPFLNFMIEADTEVCRAHYLDVYAGRGGKLPEAFRSRQADFPGRFRDLEVCRLLGIYPNTRLPAYHAFLILLTRRPKLDDFCTGAGATWPACPYARKGYYDRIASAGRVGNLEIQTRQGERMDGRGLWALVRPRTRLDMKEAKERSAAHILEKADHLYIRPSHALCILCVSRREEPLIQDNLIELRRRMESDPEIPVTLVEGPCMVCDPCNVWHPAENLCYAGHPKDLLRDLMVLRRLGLPPGATLPARELYRRIYRRISSNRDICGWGDELNSAPFWSPCSGYRSDTLAEARRLGLLLGPPQVRPTSVASPDRGPDSKKKREPKRS